MRKEKFKPIFAFIIAFIMITATFYGSHIKGRAKSSSNPYVHIDQADYDKKTGVYKITYSVTEKIPNGYTLQIGMEYSKSYRMPDKVITVTNKKGTYTQRFKSSTEPTQVYLKGIARDYISKNIIKKSF